MFIGCGLGAWVPVLIAFCMVFLLLIGGGGMECWMHRRWERNRPSADPDPNPGDRSG